MMDNFNETYPKIGQNIKTFINHFGIPKQISGNGSLYIFDLGLENSSYLTINVVNDHANNISFSRITNKEFSSRYGVELFAYRFIPSGLQPLKEVREEVIERVNADVPVSFIEYFSESSKESKGYGNKDEERGYVTVFICHDGNDSSMVVALGREEAIQ
jgi:hypothetical protein